MNVLVLIEVGKNNSTDVLDVRCRFFSEGQEVNTIVPNEDVIMDKGDTVVPDNFAELSLSISGEKIVEKVFKKVFIKNYIFL